MRQLFMAIKAKGWLEQERCYLFPGLYNNNKVSKATKGEFKQFDNELKKGKHER